MKRLFSMLAIAVAMLLFAAGACQSKSVLDEKLDQNTIKALLEHGQLLNLSFNEKGEVTQRMCAVIINAKPDVVWSVITDFKNYDKFVPDMEPPVLRNRKEDEVTVDFVLKIKIVMGVSSTQKYSTRYVLKKPILYMHDEKDAKKEPGFWKIVPVDGGSRTMLFYNDTAPDLTKMGSLVSGLVSAKPEIGLALQVSPISILLNETKAYAEKK